MAPGLGILCSILLSYGGELTRSNIYHPWCAIPTLYKKVGPPVVLSPSKIFVLSILVFTLSIPSLPQFFGGSPTRMPSFFLGFEGGPWNELHVTKPKCRKPSVFYGLPSGSKDFCAFCICGTDFLYTPPGNEKNDANDIYWVQIGRGKGYAIKFQFRL